MKYITLSIILLALASCSSGDSQPSSTPTIPTTPPTAVPSEQTIPVELEVTLRPRSGNPGWHRLELRYLSNYDEEFVLTKRWMGDIEPSTYMTDMGIVFNSSNIWHLDEAVVAPALNMYVQLPVTIHWQVNGYQYTEHFDAIPEGNS